MFIVTESGVCSIPNMVEQPHINYSSCVTADYAVLLCRVECLQGPDQQV
jgi:hypothetical protein